MDATLLRAPYNYPAYRRSILAQPLRGLGIGTCAPQMMLQDLDGRIWRLGDLQPDWHLVLEAGSLTCPQFLWNGTAMEELAQEFGPPRGHFRFFVLYTREAHPGERLSHHRSMEQKLQYARWCQREEHLLRPVLVEGLDGELHRALGGFPNMVYVIDRQGHVAYRALWNHPSKLRRVLDQLYYHDLSPEDPPHPPAYTEDLDLGPIRMRTVFAHRALERAGPQAIKNFEESMGPLSSFPFRLLDLLARKP